MLWQILKQIFSSVSVPSEKIHLAASRLGRISFISIYQNSEVFFARSDWLPI